MPKTKLQLLEPAAKGGSERMIEQDLIIQRLASLEYRVSKIQKQLKSLIPYRLDKRIERVELWCEAHSNPQIKKEQVIE